MADTGSLEGFRGPEACKIVGITYRQLDYWARTDLVRPSLSDAHGSGTQRLYLYTDLVKLRTVKRLLDAGLSLKMARKAIDFLQTKLGEELITANLVIDGDRVFLSAGDQLIDLLREGQGVLNVLPLGPMVTDLDAKIYEHRPAVGEESHASEPGEPPEAAAR